MWSGPAAADGGPPVIHPRRAWGARRPKEHARVLRGGPDHIVVHHTATPNSGDASLAHAFALSRAIQRFHMGGRGWSDIGEQLTISRGGHIMEGRNRSLRAMLSGRHAVGAQTLNHNSHTIGIENEGNYMRAPVPPALWSSLVRVCGWLCTVYGLDPYRAIVGHRDFNATSCPGDVLYARLPELRRQAAGLIGRPGPVVPAPKSSTGTGGDVEDDEQFDFGDYDDSGPV
nr:peptidoglycan recognition family protein [Actinomadura alba]